MNFKTILAAVIVAIIVIAGIAGAYWLTQEEEGNVVYWTPIGPNLQKAAVASGEVDGGVAWEPYCSDGFLDGTTNIWKWSDELWPGHPCCIVAVDNQFAVDHPDLVKRVVKVHVEANRWIAEALSNTSSPNYTMLLEMGADFSNRNTTVIASSLEHLKFQYEFDQDFRDGLEVITEKYIEQGLVAESKIQDRGYSNISDFVASFINPAWLVDIDDVQPSETILGQVRLAYLTGDVHQLARVVAMNATVGGGENLFVKYGIGIIDPNPGGYGNGGAIMTAFAGGQCDIGYLGSPPAILQHLNAGVDISLAAVVNTEGSAIFVNPSITSIDDFEGKTFATPGVSSIQHLILLDYLTSQGYKVKQA
jgi:ABC-type taurine transport system substrate-binding protein